MTLFLSLHVQKHNDPFNTFRFFREWMGFIETNGSSIWSFHDHIQIMVIDIERALSFACLICETFKRVLLLRMEFGHPRDRYGSSEMLQLARVVSTNNSTIKMIEVSNNSENRTVRRFKFCFTPLLGSLMIGINSVTILKLNEINLGKSGALELCKMLRSSSCQVCNLQVSETNFTKTGATSLFRTLRLTGSRLRILHMGSNYLNDRVANEIGISLSHPNCILTNLNLDGNDFTASGCQAFAAGLAHENNELCIFSLGGNPLGNDGVQVICESLAQKFCKLQRLSLWATNINHELDSNRIVKILRHQHCSLEVLDLSENENFNPRTVHAALSTLKLARLLKVLLSPHNRTSRSAIRRLPQELFRLIKSMLDQSNKCQTY